MIRSVKELALSVSAGATHSIGLAAPVRHITRSKIPILTYHSIGCSEGNPPSCLDLTWMRVAPEQFRVQMEYVAKHYNTVNLKEIQQARSGQLRLPPHPCVITFDDGYMDAYENAVPVLKKLGLKATFFIIGRPTVTQELPWLHSVHQILDANDFLECASVFRKAAPSFFPIEPVTKEVLCDLVWRYFREEERPARQRFLDGVRGGLGDTASTTYRFMRECHVKELHAAGYEIGCHSMDHEYMTLLSCDDLKQDIRQCKQTLADLLGETSNLFCYPFGAFNAEMMQILKQEGFAFACTTRSKLNDVFTNPLALYRIGVYSYTTFPLFVFRLIGLEAGARDLYKFVRSFVGGN
jgi:peptidoglycan/xylan/chitin deacetylase (PgdA/CDA1 family)